MRITRVYFAVGWAVGALLLASCGNGSSSAPASAPAPAAASSTTQNASAVTMAVVLLAQ